MKVFRKTVCWPGMFHDMDLFFVEIPDLDPSQIISAIQTISTIKSGGPSKPSFRITAESVRSISLNHAFPIFLPLHFGEDGERVQAMLSAPLRSVQKTAYLQACAMDPDGVRRQFQSCSLSSFEFGSFGIGSTVRVNVDAVLQNRGSVDPDSILSWWLDHGDHDETFTIQGYYPNTFPNCPYTLDKCLCETSFSQKELIPVA